MGAEAVFCRGAPSCLADDDDKPAGNAGGSAGVAPLAAASVARVGCAECHPPALYTDLKAHDVGTQTRGDKPSDKFDTPTLVECWRTAPYLHDGSAATMREVLTTANRNDRHGKTSHLTDRQIEDLVAFLLSL